MRGRQVDASAVEQVQQGHVGGGIHRAEDEARQTAGTLAHEPHRQAHGRLVQLQPAVAGGRGLAAANEAAAIEKEGDAGFRDVAGMAAQRHASEFQPSLTPQRHPVTPLAHRLVDAAQQADQQHPAVVEVPQQVHALPLVGRGRNQGGARQHRRRVTDEQGADQQEEQQQERPGQAQIQALTEAALGAAGLVIGQATVGVAQQPR